MCSVKTWNAKPLHYTGRPLNGRMLRLDCICGSNELERHVVDVDMELARGGVWCVMSTGAVKMSVAAPRPCDGIAFTCVRFGIRTFSFQAPAIFLVLLSIFAILIA